MKWLIDLDYVCKEMGVGIEIRNSVPEYLDTREKMRKFLQELQRDYEEWRAMKLIVLGNGRIGKTTLLHTIRHFLNQPLNETVWLFLYFFYLTLYIPFLFLSKLLTPSSSRKLQTLVALLELSVAICN
jgi:hypothetical protein